MARSRTTKTLAKRIQLDYFTWPHPFRTLRKRTSLIVLALVAVGSVVALLPSQRIYWSAGRLTSAHLFFQMECGACHGPGLSGAVEPGGKLLTAGEDGSAVLASAAGSVGAVSNEACSACHVGPKHQESQTVTPACASCHLEHRGGKLSEVADAFCTDCHAALDDYRDKPSEIGAVVTGFPEKHPEFAAVRKGVDEARLRVNHKLHLKKGLKTPGGEVTLSCSSCHVVDRQGMGMQPMSYEKHCVKCHALKFDQEGWVPPETSAPHGDPNGLIAFLVDTYAAVAVSDKSAGAAVDPVARALALRRSRKPGVSRNADIALALPSGSDGRFVIDRTRAAVTVLERATCALCHGRSDQPPAESPRGELPPPPVIPAAGVTKHWMPASIFSHQAHRTLDCQVCHAGAATSETTTDVLLPEKKICGSCHHSGKGAPVDCITCHRYHPRIEAPHSPAIFDLPAGGGLVEGS